MQGEDSSVAMDVQPPPASPPPLPAVSSPMGHQARPSTASMQRAMRSNSRITEGATSRLSDEESKTAVKVGQY